MTIDLTCVPAEAVSVCVDYFSGIHSLEVPIRYENNKAIVGISKDDLEQEFSKELNDCIKRVVVAERTRKMKEIIIGRALYGILESN